MVTLEEFSQQIESAEEQASRREQEIELARERASGIQAPPGTISLQFALEREPGGVEQALQRIRLQKQRERERALGQVSEAEQELASFERRIQEQRIILLAEEKRIADIEKERSRISERARSLEVARRLASRGASAREIRRVTGVKARETPIEQIVDLKSFEPQFFPGATLGGRELFFVSEESGTKFVVGKTPEIRLEIPGAIRKETKAIISELDLPKIDIIIPGATLREKPSEFIFPDLDLTIKEKATITKIPEIPSMAFGAKIIIEEPTRIEMLRDIAFTEETKGDRTIFGQIGGFGAGFATPIISGAEFTKQLISDPLETIGRTAQAIPRLPEALGGVGDVLFFEPSFSIGFIAGEIALFKGGQFALTKGRDVFDIVRTRISSGFRPVEKGSIIGVPSRQDFFFERPGLTLKTLAGEDISSFGAKIPGTLDIPIAPPISQLGISLKEQAKIAGTKVTAISAQTGFPSFDIPLKKTLFADPFGRLRVSRLGLSDDIANLQDILSSKLSFRRGAKQAFVFEDVGVAKLPKDISKAFDLGKPLTAKQIKTLTKFQSRVSGEFAPIGRLSTEPEIILSSGEIVKRVKDLGATLISPRSKKFFDLPKRVEIIRTEVVKPTARTSQLLGGVSLTSKEQRELLGRLAKETGFSIKDLSSPLRDTKFISPSGLGISISSQIKKTDFSSTLSLPKQLKISSLSISPKKLSKQLSGFSLPKPSKARSTLSPPLISDLIPPSSPFKPLKDFGGILFPTIKFPDLPRSIAPPIIRRTARAKKKKPRKLRRRPFSPPIRPSFSAIVLDLKGQLPTGFEFFGGRAGIIPGAQFRFVPSRKRKAKKRITKTKKKRRTAKRRPRKDFFRSLTSL